MKIKMKRIYVEAEPQDGYRLLVDRLWPRGISKEMAAIDEWDKDIAPSAELRKWFSHIPERFTEFSKRYKEELKDKTDDLKRIKSLSNKQTVTLLYGAKDIHNQATVLLEVLARMK